jgi:hypothetical protein
MKGRTRTGGSVGGASIGYRNVCGGKGTRVEIDPVLAPLIRELFRLAARS